MGRKEKKASRTKSENALEAGVLALVIEGERDGVCNAVCKETVVISLRGLEKPYTTGSGICIRGERCAMCEPLIDSASIQVTKL